MNERIPPKLRKLILSLKPKKWIYIFGQPYNLRVLILQIAVVVLIIATVAGAYFYTNREIAESRDNIGGKLAEPESQIVYNEGSEIPLFKALDNIMLFHESTLGYNKIHSLLVQGNMFDGQATVEMKMMAKPPETYYQSLELDNRTLRVTFIDGKLKYDQNSALINQEDERLAEINKILMVMECAIPLPVWLYADPTNNFYLTRQYDEVYNDRECAVVANKILKDTIIRHYIDLKTGQEISRQSEVNGYRLRVDYGELEEIKGVFFPRGYEVFLNDTFVCKAEFDSIQINRGLPEFLFER